MRLDDAQAIYIGSNAAKAVYGGEVQVWPTDDPPPANAFTAAVLADDPLGFWLMDETTGTAMTDSSGNGRHGSYSATGVTLQQGGPSTVVPHSAGFSGTGSSASVAVNLAALGDYAEVTLEGWFYVPEWPSTAFLAEYTPNWNTASGAALVRTGGRLEFGVSGYDGTPYYRVRNVFTPSPGWHYYSVIWSRAAGDSLALDMRIDGVDAASLPAINNNPGPSFANSTLYLMSRGGVSGFLPGRACGVSIFPTRIPTARRDAHYAAALDPTP